MKIHDISLTLTPSLPVWPGNPQVALERVASLEAGDNHNGSRLALDVHTGTHVDAPFHFVSGGSTVETLPLDVLIGPAQVVELDETVAEITAEVLLGAGLKPGGTRVLFKTRNSRYWAEANPDFQPGFVAVSPDGAEYLVWQGYKLVGVDYLSVAPFKRSTETHQILLRHGIVVVEGLALADIPPGDYQLVCLPVKLGGSDGAPARAVLIEG